MRWEGMRGVLGLDIGKGFRCRVMGFSWGFDGFLLVFVLRMVITVVGSEKVDLVSYPPLGGGGCD